LIETVPAEGSVLSRPPETLRLVFSESIEVRFSRFALMRLPHDQSADDARRRPLVAALTDSALPEEAVLLMPVDAEQRAAAITLTPPAPPGPGRYILVWLAFSVDGHHTSGTVAFEIAAPGNG
jgi:methionine-rich copper-binding protein CopC